MNFFKSKINEQTRLMSSRSKADAKNILYKYARYSEVFETNFNLKKTHLNPFFKQNK